MKNIRLIGAGAGSGKTYKLATEVFEGIRDAKFRPNGIILTTFTTRAAAELKDRVAQRLIHQGLPQAAQRIGQSLIGTVDSVCAQIVKDYAFECGLAMEQNMIDPSSANQLFQRALNSCISEADHSEMTAQMRSVGVEDWIQVAESLCDAARLNLLSPKDLPLMAEDAVNKLFVSVKSNTNGRKNFIASAESLAKEIRTTIETLTDKTKKTKDAFEMLVYSINAAKANSQLNWKIITKFKNEEIAKKNTNYESFENLKEAVDLIYCWPEFKVEVSAAIKRIFKVAETAILAHTRTKSEIDSVDFTDVAVSALRALDHESVRESIADRIDVLMVDEFQDTSPTQMALFAKLSGIIKNVIWVGDPKQAIYGFRGADSELMLATIGALSKTATAEKLGKSYRSCPELVEFVNLAFEKLFLPIGIKRADVGLEPTRTDQIKTKPLQSWVLTPETNAEGKKFQNIGTDASQIATRIRQVIDSDDFAVIDRKTSLPRKLEPRDIVILVRSNRHITESLMPAVTAQGIPLHVPAAGLANQPVVRTILSTMALLIDPRDRYAAANIRYHHRAYVADSFDGDAWLQEAADAKSRSEEQTNNVDDLITKILAKKMDADSLHPLEVFDLAVDLSDALLVTHAMESPGLAKFQIEQARQILADYLHLQQKSGYPATVRGAISYMNSLATSADDDATPLDENAVQIMSYHKSKGMEWPMVILFGLDKVFEPDIFCARVVASTAFDMSMPLKDRRLSFWPNPCGDESGYVNMIQAKPEYAELALKQRNETLRLLYVAMTRARDVLVFAARPNALSALAIMVDDKEKPTINVPQDPSALTKDESKIWNVTVLQTEAGQLKFRPAPMNQSYLYCDRGELPPGRVTPSSAALIDDGKIQVSEPLSYSNRLPVKNTDNYDVLGDAIHAFLSLDRTDQTKSKSIELATEILKSFDMTKFVDPENLVEQADCFEKKISEMFPAAKIFREIPVGQISQGVITKGFADMILESEEGLVVIDHKSYGGVGKGLIDRAKSYAGQLAMYRDIAEAATGKKVLGCYINFVVVGSMVRVTLSY